MKEKRVINIPKTDFDYIKEYCDKNTLDMTKWMVKIIKNHIDVIEMFTPRDPRELDDYKCNKFHLDWDDNEIQIKDNDILNAMKEIKCNKSDITWKEHFGLKDDYTGETIYQTNRTEIKRLHKVLTQQNGIVTKSQPTEMFVIISYENGERNITLHPDDTKE